LLPDWGVYETKGSCKINVPTREDEQGVVARGAIFFTLVPRRRGCGLAEDNLILASDTGGALVRAPRYSR
jgi:hypothetical protein